MFINITACFCTFPHYFPDNMKHKLALQPNIYIFLYIFIHIHKLQVDLLKTT